MKKAIKEILKGDIGKKIIDKVPDAFLTGMPKFYNIEPISICNLACAQCEYKNMTRKKDIMPYDKYTKLIDEICVNKPGVYFTAWGDGMLNPKMPEMIKYASDRGMETGISSNFCMPLGDDKIKALANSGLDYIVIDVDGASEEIYLKYRVQGNWDLLMSNIKTLVKYRDEAGAKLVIRGQCLVTRKNEHQIEAVEQLCRDLNMDAIYYYPIIPAGNHSNAYADKEKRRADAEEWLPTNNRYSRYEEDRITLKEPKKLCPFIATGMVFANGDVGTCTYDTNGRVIAGNAFDEGGFAKVWKSDKMKEIRRGIIDKTNVTCKNCELSKWEVNQDTHFNED